MDPISNEIRKAIRDIDATATMENIIEQLKNKFPDQPSPGFEVWVEGQVEASRRGTPPSPTNGEIVATACESASTKSDTIPKGLSLRPRTATAVRK